MTPESSEVITVETTREDEKEVEREKVSFEFITPEKTEVSHEEIVVEESPLPDEGKVAPTATVEEISMATTMEIEEVIPQDKQHEEVSGVTIETELSLPTEELKEVKKAPEEEVGCHDNHEISANYTLAQASQLMRFFTIQASA